MWEEPGNVAGRMVGRSWRDQKGFVRAVADGTRCMDLLDLDAYGFKL